MTAQTQQRFAKIVLAAFKTAGRHTDEEVGDADGPSTSTMSKLRKVALGESLMATPRGDTYKRIDTAAKWERGSAREVWAGGDPTPLRTVASPSVESLAAKVAELDRIVTQLARNLDPPEPPDTPRGEEEKGA
jgi:hypothetical protein